MTERAGRIDRHDPLIEQAVQSMRTRMRRVEEVFPDVWRKLDEMRSKNNRGGLRWPSWCLCPVSASVAICTHTNSMDMASELAALYAWRCGQGIYRIDEDLAEALTRTDLGEKIPPGVVFRLPEWAPYIVTTIGGEQVGILAHLEFDVIAERCELRLIVDDLNGTAGDLFVLHLAGETLNDAVDSFFTTAADNARAAGRELTIPAEARGEYRAQLETFLPFVLYLCSDNPDILGTNDTALPTPATPTKTKRGERLFPPATPQLWDVGWRVGSVLHAHNQPTRHSTTGEGTGVRPHLRRAHWHTYWTGEGSRTDRTRRQARLRWVAPVLVGEHATAETLIPVARTVLPSPPRS